VANKVILIDGIKAKGRHGANPGEQLEPQDFVIDLQVWVEVDFDALESTADYRGIVAAAKKTVETDSYHLLETLAEAVARAVYDRFAPVARVIATVHKPAAAGSIDVGDLAVEATVETE
jgi:7,8-dihydroneopterin aldolase/epimerase/oxygenase